MRPSQQNCYRRSLNYELNRMGFSIGFRDKDGLLLETEGGTLFASHGDRTFKFDIHLAARSLWNMSTKALSAKELILTLGQS